MKLPDVSGLVVACDTECSGLFPDDGARISVVSAAWRYEGELQSISVPFDQGLANGPGTQLPLGPKFLPSRHERRLAKWDPADTWAPNRTPRAWDTLTAWLARQQLVFHNAKYDLQMFMAGQRGRTDGGLAHFVSNVWDGGAVNLAPATAHDTMLACGQLWPGFPAGLKDTAVRLHIGEPLGVLEGDEAADAEALGPWKGPQDDPRYDLIPWRVIGPYARLDAELTLLLHERQQSEMNVTILSRVEEEMALMRTLLAMELRGVGFDREGCLKQLAVLDELIRSAAEQVPFRGGNGKPTAPAAAKYFFGAAQDGGQGLLPYSDKLTRGGRPQTDEEVIARLVKLGVPGAREYARYQELNSARSKWYAAYPALTGPDGRLRTCHRQGRVVSGRLSVERWQAQALPHDYQIPSGLVPIRDLIGSDPDGEFEDWEADASQAEIRVATRIAKEKNMLRALRAGVDSHSAACRLMFYPSRSLAEAKQDREWDRYRQVAKRCNLGILYGIGSGGLRTQIAKFTGYEYSLDECRTFIADWKNAFPGFARALYEYSQMATENGYVRLITGKVRKFSDYEPVHKAFNQRVQGDVSEAMRIAMVKFDRDFPGVLLLQIHDSLVGQIPRARLDEVRTGMVAAITDTFGRLFSPVPFTADCKPFGRTAARYAHDR